ncbi:1-acyl-sn-glycerol-3-phosphate acyltransferase [Hyphococcus sp.]|uniref:1-acyl-sn-glycerol-3-phosphate acyltransferase n=1 Tax=Hyphococcus sp. TaxID=2038636 RepID=UPI00207EEF60|nr:MAG: acyltransferase [Marinicaulis sp.]
MDAVSPAKAENGINNGQHIVDELIEERAHRLRASPLWPLYKSILYPLLLYKPAVNMADAIADDPARSVFDYISNLLSLDVQVSGLEHLPQSGRVLIASTHPTGIPDGVAMFDAIKNRRPDMTFFANRDALRAAPGLEDMIIPVEWVQAKRTATRSRETLESAIKAFQADKCVVLFPSGRLAFMDKNKQLVEQEWLATIATFARKYNCPVVPANIKMRNSWLYYWFWNLNIELRDITLFHELLNKKNKTYRMTFGPAIAASDLKGDPKRVAAALREHAMALGEAPQPWRPIA